MRIGPALPTAAGGAAAARLAWTLLRRGSAGARWDRVNHAGRPVTLLEGPALAAAVTLAAALAPGVPARVRAAGAVACAGAAVFGAVDDLGESGSSKGLRGHLGELGRGRLSTGGIKLVGIAATGLAASAVLEGPRPAARQALVGGALIAGCANLVNLLDLRPGRALKSVLLTAPAALTAGPAAGLVAAAVGPAAALLPVDLDEQAMLGDTGANAVGAMLGTALVAALGPRARVLALAVVVGLTLASERVSFTRVIESTPVLRELDALGRRPR